MGFHWGANEGGTNEGREAEAGSGFADIFEEITEFIAISKATKAIIAPITVTAEKKRDLVNRKEQDSKERLTSYGSYKLW